MLNQRDQDEHVLREMISAQEAAWNRGDAVAWASPFTENARFVTLRGDVFLDHDEIEKSHLRIFSSFYKGSYDTATIESLSFPTENVAIIDVLHEIRNYATLPPGISPTEPGVLRARMKYVAVKHGTTWKFASAQNTGVFPKLETPKQ